MSTLSFADYCKSGNLEEVKRALERGEDVNKTDEYGTTGLMWAVWNKHNAVVELLLSQPGVDVNWVNNDGRTALYWACHGNNVEGLKMLLAHPSMNSHNVEDRYGRTPLMCAINRGYTSCIRELLKNKKVELDIGSVTPSTEIRMLIEEEKQRREEE